MDFTKFKGIIFDLDGTLVESNGVWSQIDIDFLGERGFEVPDDYGKVVSAMDFRQAAIYTKERFGLPESIEQIGAGFQTGSDIYKRAFRSAREHRADRRSVA